MKKLLALLLALVMVIGMVACGAKEAPKADAPATQPAADAPADDTPAADSAKPYEGATVTWWHYPFTGEDQGYWDERAAVF